MNTFPNALILFLTAILFTGCQTERSSLRGYCKTPVISIDSIFQQYAITNGNAHAKRLTDAVSKLLDSLSKDHTFTYSPNYKLEKKRNADYVLSAILGPAKFPDSDRLVASLRGFTIDSYTKLKRNDFGCFIRENKSWWCLHYDPSKPDSTDYEHLTASLSFGFFGQRLVPFSDVLQPINSNKPFKSFSIEKSIRTGIFTSKKIKTNLTHLLNNVLVFSQSTYPRTLFINNNKYNYFNNYSHKRKERKKADFQIQAALTENKTSYILNFIFTGKDINFSLMEDAGISTTIVLDKKRIESGDYSEAMIKVTPLLNTFILHQTLFDSTYQ